MAEKQMNDLKGSSDCKKTCSALSPAFQYPLKDIPKRNGESRSLAKNGSHPADLSDRKRKSKKARQSD